MCALLLGAAVPAEAQCEPHCFIDVPDCKPYCFLLEIASPDVVEQILELCKPHC